MQLDAVQGRWTPFNAVQCARLLPTRSPNLGTRPPAVDRPLEFPFAQAGARVGSGHVVSFPCLIRGIRVGQTSSAAPKPLPAGTLRPLTQPTLTDEQGSW